MYKLTKRAEDDFIGIYDYTLLKFGEAQADYYTDALEAFLDMLSETPGIGRDYLAVPGVMRVEFQRYTVFYILRDTDILVARILHQQMDHLRHFL